MEERKSKIIYHRNILNDKSKSKEERKASRKILLELLNEIEDIKDKAMRKREVNAYQISKAVGRLR